MAKHRDANTNIELEDREEFINENAVILVNRLEARATRLSAIIHKQYKTIREQRRQIRRLKNE